MKILAQELESEVPKIFTLTFDEVQGHDWVDGIDWVLAYLDEYPPDKPTSDDDEWAKDFEEHTSMLKDLKKTIENVRGVVQGANVQARLEQRQRKETGRQEWALVSKSKPGKVLKWFGTKKPSDAEVLHEERRVQYFKNL